MRLGLAGGADPSNAHGFPICTTSFLRLGLAGAAAPSNAHGTPIPTLFTRLGKDVFAKSGPRPHETLTTIISGHAERD
jgi:hypothetical protein